MRSLLIFRGEYGMRAKSVMGGQRTRRLEGWQNGGDMATRGGKNSADRPVACRLNAFEQKKGGE